MRNTDTKQLQDICNEIKTARRLRNDAALVNNFRLRDIYKERLDDKYELLKSFMQQHELATADVRPLLV